MLLHDHLRISADAACVSAINAPVASAATISDGRDGTRTPPQPHPRPRLVPTFELHQLGTDRNRRRRCDHADRSTHDSAAPSARAHVPSGLDQALGPLRPEMSNVARHPRHEFGLDRRDRSHHER